MTNHPNQLINDLDCISISKTAQLLNRYQHAACVLDTNRSPLIINKAMQALIAIETDSQPTTLEQIDQHLTFFIHKRSAKQLSFADWTSQEVPQALTEILWLKTPNRSVPQPVQLEWHEIQEENQGTLYLVLITDQSLNLQLEAQNRLMNASFAGQFITNSQGLMTQTNYSFCAYTGLLPEDFAKMTYIDWLQKQVSFNEPFNSVMSALLEEHKWSGEVRLFASQETQFYAVLSLSMLVDEQNNIEHFIGVLQDITDLREAKSEIQHLAYFDRLTGLANRTLITQRIEQSLELAKEHDTFVSLFFIDLDGFKIINDTFGHSAGDQLLIQVSERLRKHVEPEDTLARLSGDEFMILKTCETQDRDTAFQDAMAFGNQLVDSLDKRYKLTEHSIHSAASVGICIFPIAADADTRADQLTSYADMAMYEAKKRGGNQTYLFERSLIEEAKQRLELIEALNHSEMDEEFQIYFQAQMDKDGNAVSAETLLRWFHPVLGFVSPAKFIPVAEEGRQIIKIGLWVMHKAFLQAKAWNKKFRDIRIAINISPIQFHEQSFIELIIGLIKFTQVDPKTITLELTEGVLIRNSKLALQKIQHLVSLGFEVSIDDFGTGYSSLSYLQKLPIHELKIDQSFIAHVPGNPDDEAIVDSIIKLAETKNLKLVAEGVETQEQSDFLTEKCEKVLLQGYLYSKPMPAEEFENNFIKEAISA